MELVCCADELLVRGHLFFLIFLICLIVLLTQIDIILFILFSCCSFLCGFVETLPILLRFILRNLGLHKITKLLLALFLKQGMVLLGRVLKEKNSLVRKN